MPGLHKLILFPESLVTLLEARLIPIIFSNLLEQDPLPRLAAPLKIARIRILISLIESQLTMKPPLFESAPIRNIFLLKIKSPLPMKSVIFYVPLVFQ
jgi:hypothetical protein